MWATSPSSGNRLHQYENERWSHLPAAQNNLSALSLHVNQQDINSCKWRRVLNTHIRPRRTGEEDSFIDNGLAKTAMEVKHAIPILTPHNFLLSTDECFLSLYLANIVALNIWYCFVDTASNVVSSKYTEGLILPVPLPSSMQLFIYWGSDLCVNTTPNNYYSIHTAGCDMICIECYIQ